MKKTKFFIYNVYDCGDCTLEFDNLDECLSELERILEGVKEVYPVEYIKEFKPDKREVEDMTCGLYKIIRPIKGVHIKWKDGVEQILFIFEGIEEYA